MLSDIKKQSLTELLKNFSRDDLIWTSGYIGGLLQDTLVQHSSLVQSLTIAYGTETGNTKNIAGKIEKLARSYGIKVKNIALIKNKIGRYSSLRPPYYISQQHAR